MPSFFREGNTLSFQGYKGTIVQITETYRKNVLVLKVTTQPPRVRGKYQPPANTIGIFEYPDGTLEFMTVID